MKFEYQLFALNMAMEALDKYLAKWGEEGFRLRSSFRVNAADRVFVMERKKE